MTERGTLYLAPTPLGAGALHTLPAYVLDILHRLDVFVAERLRTARRLLAASGHPRPIGELTFFELNQRTEDGRLPGMLAPLLDGRDVGLLSEAGCPGVADPGARLVRLAHAEGVRVVPLPGPSSILLALMASGLNGQRFCFHGYLSPKKGQLARDLRRLEQLSARHDQTQLFMETPYRNRQLWREALQTLDPATRLGVAADLTLPTEWVRTRTVEAWQRQDPPDLHKRPAIFLLQA